MRISRWNRSSASKSASSARWGQRFLRRLKRDMAGSGLFQHATDGRRQRRPVFFFSGQPFPASGGDAVEARLAVVLGDAPRRLHPARLSHAMEGGVEGAGLDLEHFARNLLNPVGDREAVHGVGGREDSEDQQVERTLELVFLVISHRCLYESTITGFPRRVKAREASPLTRGQASCVGGNPTHVARLQVQNRYSENRRTCNMLTMKDLFVAERVGFVPDEPAPLNDLGAIATARIRQIR